MDWTTMIPGMMDDGSQPGLGGFSGIVNPDPTQDIFAQAMRPAANPQEVNNRMQGWTSLLQRFQQDPNLQRAMMLTGAMMMQPVQPGQTAMGNTANAAVVGMNAYTAGQAADREAMIKRAQEGRAERELQAREAESGERVAGSRQTREFQAADRPLDVRGRTAEVEGKELSTDLARRTVDDRVRQLSAQADLAVTQAENAQDDQAVMGIERELKRRVNEAKLNSPHLAQSIDAELQASMVKLQQIRADIGLKNAQGRKARAEASVAEEEAKMTPEQRAAAGAKRQPTTAEIDIDFFSKAYDQSETIRSQNPDKAAWMVKMRTMSKEGGPEDKLKAINETLQGFTQTRNESPENKALRTQLEAARARYARELTGQPAPGGNNAGTVTMDQVNETARNRGVSPQTIIEALRKRGINVQGAPAQRGPNVVNPRDVR